MQEHPDTVGGAMLTGVREAVRAVRMLRGASEEQANAAAGAVDGALPSRKRKQVSPCFSFCYICCCCCCTFYNSSSYFVSTSALHNAFDRVTFIYNYNI